MDRDRPMIDDGEGRTTGPGRPGARGRERPGGDRGATLPTAYRKTSFVSAVTVDGDSEGVEQGWEHGCVGPARRERSGPAARLAPPVETGRDDAGSAFDRELARRLRRAIEEVLAPACGGWRIEAVVSRADVAERLRTSRGPERWERTVRAAQISVGGLRGRPRWSRVVPLSGPHASVPGAWIAALRDEVSGWRLPDAARQPDLDGAFVAAPFAAADVLRVAATAWLRGGRVPGERVAADAVGLVDPGFRFPARGGDRDAAGAAVHPTVVVQGGRLVRLPAAGGADGFLVRDSWRRPPRTDWRSLSLELPGSGPPGDVPVVTRVLIVGRLVLASGWLPRRGAPRERFGPVPAPSPAAWLLRAGRAAGPQVEDATGVPVRVPPLFLDPA